jgi:hypothetical protein
MSVSLAGERINQGLQNPDLQVFDAQVETEFRQAGAEHTAQTDQLLAEVDNINRLRQQDGTHYPPFLGAIHQNLLTGVKEAAMPYAVSTVYHPFKGEYLWLDQAPVDVARSGYTFHKSEAALRRVDVEVEEAMNIASNLNEGMIRVFVSPKMSSEDAPYKVAEQEHLADDDMIRIHMIDRDEESGRVKGKFMQSLLVRDIPLAAWVKLFKDSNNIFGRGFELEDEASALSIMKLHHELELPEAALPEGTISLIEAVLPYMEEADRAKVAPRLELFRSGQKELHQKAESIADRWLAFEVALADSLAAERANGDVEQFAFQLQNEWSEPMLKLVKAHRLPDGGLRMSRPLAAKLEQAKQNTLWTAAAVATGNEEVLGQLDSVTAEKIRESEQVIQAHLDVGRSYHEIAALQASMNRLIAVNNVRVGAGCPGKNSGDFGGSGQKNTKDNPLNDFTDFDPFRKAAADEDEETAEKDAWTWVSGYCRIEECPSLPSLTEVGRCDVCRGCQYVFDIGKDPSELYARPREVQERETGLYLMDVIFQSEPHKAVVPA